MRRRYYIYSASRSKYLCTSAGLSWWVDALYVYRLVSKIHLFCGQRFISYLVIETFMVLSLGTRAYTHVNWCGASAVGYGQIKNLVIIGIFDTKLLPWIIRCLQSCSNQNNPMWGTSVHACLIACSRTSESWCRRGTHSESSIQENSTEWTQLVD